MSRYRSTEARDTRDGHFFIETVTGTREGYERQLKSILEAPVDESRLWNGRKVADWMSRLLERPVAPQRGWEYLKQMEFRLRIPRPEHQQQDPIEQEAWKKTDH